MNKKKTQTPSNPLPCGCAAMGKSDIEMIGPDCELRERFIGIHVVHCPLHSAAPELLAALESVEHDVRQRAMPDLKEIRAAIAKATNGANE